MKILTCDCGLLHEQCIVNYCICRDVWMYRTREVVEMVVGIKGGSWVGRWMGRVEGIFFKWDASQDLTFFPPGGMQARI